MKLSRLLEHVETSSCFQDVDISFVTDKFSNVDNGCLFVCVKGKNFDGYSVAEEALEKGAAAIVTEYDMGLENQIIVENTRKAFSMLCSALNNNPPDKLKIIGVTGTNGKTSTAAMIRELLEKTGHKTGLLGTVNNIMGDEKLVSELTTDEPDVLYKNLGKMVSDGCEYCVMEVSSQALSQERVAGINFKVGVFTNLTVDHLDYHGDMESYRDAKKKLFDSSEISILNSDDENAEYMVAGVAGKATYSIKNDSADYTAKNIKLSEKGVLYELVGKGIIGRIKVDVPGEFTVYNSMAAAVTGLELGIKMTDITEAFSAFDAIKGRMETVPTGRDFSVIIDYAHTPDGLENLLNSLRKVYQGKIITVFGCGGDRDKSKRPLMGEIAGRLSDITIVTSDNPRSEDPEMIINDILVGLENVKSRVFAITDRTEAIGKALKKAKAGDVVVLAGKGHETYQILKDGKIHYDEREIIKEILNS